jgi:hypothetical protein
MKSMEWIHARCREDGDCMLWDGSQDDGGRPRVAIRDGGKPRTFMPRRIVWEAAKGPIKRGLRVTVTCGNPLCLNPEHLELITRGEVIRRTAQKPDTAVRRHLAGLKRRELSDRNMELIRYIRHSPKTGAELSRETGIPPTTISAIRLHKRWRELTNNPFAGLV